MAKIKVLKAKDKDFVRGLSHCGRMTREQAEGIGMNPTRLHNFQKDGYVERTYSFDRSKREYVESFYLTNKGRSFATAELGVESFYRSNGTNHDIALVGEYQKLSLDEQRSWMTENELRDMFKERLQELRDEGQELRAMELEQKLQEGLISPSDGGYVTSEGKIIVIEVVTKHYGPAEIQAKEEFAQVMGAELQQIKA